MVFGIAIVGLVELNFHLLFIDLLVDPLFTLALVLILLNILDWLYACGLIIHQLQFAIVDFRLIAFRNSSTPLRLFFR